MNVVNDHVVSSERDSESVTCLDLQDVDILTRKEDLQLALARLPSHNRDLLMVNIHEVLKHSHLYEADWKALTVDAALMARVVDIIRRYECHGLQLNGEGVRLLLKIAMHSRDTPQVVASLSDPSVLELLLRLAVEHPVYDNCLAVLDVAIQADPVLLVRVCEIGKMFITVV